MYSIQKAAKSTFDPDKGPRKTKVSPRIAPLSQYADAAAALKSSKPLNLPRRKKSISLYVDKADEIKLKTSGRRKGGHSDKDDGDQFLARLTFDHLSLANKARSLVGLLSTLHVAVESDSAKAKLPSH